MNTIYLKLTSISIFLLGVLQLSSCKNNLSSSKSFNDLQDYVADFLERGDEEFTKFYPFLKDYVDSLAIHAEYDGPDQFVRVEAQRKALIITSFLISKHDEYMNTDGYEEIIEELQAIRNKWICVSLENSSFFLHEHLYTSYKNTDDEIDDFFTLYVFPQDKMVLLSMPFCAKEPPSAFFSESFSEDMDDYSYYNFEDIFEYEDSDEDSLDTLRLKVIGDEEVFDYMMKNNFMILHFRGDRPESDGYSGIEKALINLSGLHQIYEYYSK